MAEEDTPLEAGVGFVCDFQKPVDFIGRDALLRQREQPLRKRLVQFLLEDPETFLYHHEPILRDGNVVGYLTSGNYGHTLGGSVGLGYVRSDGGGRRAMDRGRAVRDRRRGRAGSGAGEPSRDVRSDRRPRPDLKAAAGANADARRQREREQERRRRLPHAGGKRRTRQEIQA